MNYLRCMKLLTRLVLISTILICITVTSFAHAQTSPFDWSTPKRIIQDQGAFSEPILIADQSGRLHFFWAPLTQTTQSLYYSQFNGNNWTQPVDIFNTNEISGYSAVVDSLGMIHLIWSNGNTIYYSQAPVDEAYSAVNWSAPVAIDTGLRHGRILSSPAGADGQDKLYILYPGLSTSGPRLVTSEDGGATWSDPISISPTRNPDASSDYIAGAVSEDGTIHVVWTEFKLPQGWPPLGVYYSHSSDGGQTWIRPTEIAVGNYDQINIATYGDNTIHVAWNGAAGTGGRYHRWSQDGGETWSGTNTVLPADQGGTEGFPQLAIDNLGTLHLVTTSDQRVWYSYFQPGGGGRWSNLEYIQTGDESGIPPLGQSIDILKTRHIEYPAMAISNGNQLQLVFWDERPSQQMIQYWYTTRQTSASATALKPFPTPISSPTQVSEASTVKASTTSVTPSPTIDLNSNPDATDPNPGWPILVAILPVALLMTMIVVVRISRIQRKR